MFRDDYNNEMNKLRPDADTKNAILEELQSGGEADRRRRATKSKLYWRLGTAAVACAMALTVIFIPRTGEEPRTVKSSGNEVLQAVSYEDVYKTISKIYGSRNDNRNPFVRFFDYITGGGTKNEDQEIIYEYTTEEDAVDFNYNSTGSATATTQTDDGASPESSIEDSNAADGDYTETNTQVEGVDEADIVKTDGKYIYALYNNEVRIILTDNGKMTLLNKLQLKHERYMNYSEMYLSNERLCITATDAYNDITMTLIIDVSDPSNAQTIGICEQTGGYHDSRLIGNSLYLISNYYIDVSNAKQDDPSTYVPCVTYQETEYVTDAEDIRIYDCYDLEAVYTVVCGYDITDASLTSTQSILGRCDAVYCSTENLLTARSCGKDDETNRNYSIITRFSIDKGNIEYVTDNRIAGTLLNQFSMDEADDSFRFVTTVSKYEESNAETEQSVSSSVSYDVLTDTAFVQTGNTSAALYLLDFDLQPLGKIEDLAPGERIYSVRFMGDIAYFVTFRETDPLFSADLSDPKNPRILGQLKIPGFSNYLFPYGDGQLLGLGMEADESTGATECMKLSMFDISDPSNVSEYSKYLIEDSQYSDALYNHKASLVDSKRDLIGFACFTEGSGGIRYRVYSCENGFAQVADLPLNKTTGYMSRGIVIGNVLYVVEGYRATSYSLDSFTQLQSVVF